MLPFVLLGIGLVVGSLLILRWFIDAEPRQAARLLKWSAIGIGGALGVYLLLTGRWTIVAAVAATLFPLLRAWRVARFRQRAQDGPAPGSRSGLTTAWLEIELDHDSGTVRGTVLEGRFKGRTLDSLTVEDLMEVVAECRAAGDVQSVAVLEAYLDRQAGPGWAGEARQEEAAAGRGRSRRRGRAPSSGGPMARAEALEVLGLDPDASPQEIKDAHRRLMLRIHPDHGGSDYLAAKLNEAKEVLLGD